MTPAPTPADVPARCEDDASTGDIARQALHLSPVIFPEHRLAHELLDGLSGLEIGAAAYNPFGLKTRNVASPEGHEFYAE